MLNKLRSAIPAVTETLDEPTLTEVLSDLFLMVEDEDSLDLAVEEWNE